jgi:hypothetical protein
LLSEENGATLVTASLDGWSRMIDGSDTPAVLWGEAAFAFRKEDAAVFDTFTVLVSDESALNLRDFELLTSTESALGPFKAVGRFHTRNTKLFKTPFQESRSRLYERISEGPCDFQSRGTRTLCRSRVPVMGPPRITVADGFAPSGKLSRVLTFTFTNAKIARIEVIGDPAHLCELDITVL